MADLKAQSVIIKGLRKFWPKINIVGEEETEYTGTIEFDFNTLNSSLLKPDMFIEGK